MLNDDLRIFFARSKLRIEILKKLKIKSQIASFLAHDMKKHREVISRIFLDLQDKGLAKCKNPEDPNFRRYQITQKGKQVLESLE